MVTVHFRVIQVVTSERSWIAHRFSLLVASSNNQDKEYKFKIEGTDVLASSRTLTFNTNSQITSSLIIKMIRNRIIHQVDDLGKLEIPLSWIPTNRVVREWFPLNVASPIPGEFNTYLCLEIHVDTRGAEPFMAEFAPLRVYPCWSRPKQLENSDFPMRLPMIYSLPAFQSHGPIIPPPINLHPPEEQKQDIKEKYEFEGNIDGPKTVIIQCTPGAPPPQTYFTNCTIVLQPTKLDMETK